MAKPETLASVRRVMLFIAGMSCAIYALSAFWIGRPDPFAWWVPTAFGLAAGGVITAAFLWAGPKAAREATDELHKQVNHKAQRHAYIITLGLFAGAALLVNLGVVDLPTATAVFGTLMGASYLLLFALYDWQMQ
jgi:hypothetical protein